MSMGEGCDLILVPHTPRGLSIWPDRQHPAAPSPPRGAPSGPSSAANLAVRVGQSSGQGRPGHPAAVRQGLPDPDFLDRTTLSTAYAARRLATFAARTMTSSPVSAASDHCRGHSHSRGKRRGTTKVLRYPPSVCMLGPNWPAGLSALGVGPALALMASATTVIRVTHGSHPW